MRFTMLVRSAEPGPPKPEVPGSGHVLGLEIHEISKPASGGA